MPGSTYVKLHYGVTDFSAGIQSVNQLRDNFQAIYDAWAAEHSTRASFATGPRDPPQSLAFGFGRHNTPKVPRAVVKTALATTSFSVVLPGSFEVQPVVTSITRLSTGLIFIGVTDLQEFYAEVEAYQDSSTPARVVIPRTSIGGSGGASGITVECYETASVGSGFDLADFDISAVIYGTT